MTTITLRSVKGSPLLNSEIDSNFSNLNTYKVEQDASGNVTVGGVLSVLGMASAASLWATAAFSGTYTDGIVLDYVTGKGRISVGSSDGLSIYNGGVGGTALLNLDSSGNLGLGLTPSAWWSGTKAIQLTGAALTSTSSTAYLYQNAYLDATTQERYYANGNSSKFTLSSGGAQWFIAGSGTAGSAISFTQAMTLDQYGQLCVGGAPSSYKFSVTDGSIRCGINATSGVVTIGARDAAVSTYVPMLLDGSFIEFLASGSERMRLTSAGYLGIGITNPNAALDVRSGATTFAGQIASTGTNTYGATTSTSLANATLQLIGGGASGATTGIRLSQGGSFELYVGGVQESGGAGAFVWQGYNGSAWAERMRLTSAGYLGIGTSSPQSVLNVYSSSAGAAILTLSDGTLGVNYGGQFKGYGIGGIGGLAEFGSLDAGVYSKGFLVGQQASYLAFYTGYSGTSSNAERMRLDSSGNLGLGVTPSAWVSGAKVMQFGNYVSFGQGRAGTSDLIASWNAVVTSGTNSGTGYVYRNTGDIASAYEQNGVHRWYTAPSGTAGSAISFTQAMTLDASGNLLVGSTSTSFATANKIVEINGTGDSAFNVSVGGTNYAYFYTSTSSSIIGTRQNIPLVFNTNNTERARIDSSGIFLVGGTSAVGSGSKIGYQAHGGNGISYLLRHTGATTGKYRIFAVDSANNGLFYDENSVGMYMADGATSWTATSDIRLKTDLVPITDALEKVGKLRTVTGRFKTDEEGVSRSFFIAQDFQDNFEEALNDNNPDELGVQYSDTTPLLAAAIKELHAELQALKATLH